MDNFEIVEVPTMTGEGRSYQAHFPDGRTYHGKAASEEEFAMKVRQRLLAEEAGEAPHLKN